MLTAAPTVDQLYQLFPHSPDRPNVQEIPASAVPPPYHQLLVHTHHMTVAVEQYYGVPVQVRVLECKRVGSEYARKILLTAHSRPVQFGLVRIDLEVCPEPVRQEILAGQIPLGRILIHHNMLRRIEPVSYLRVTLSQPMANWFGVEPGTITYGRIGVIHSGNRLAVEMLEILAPISGTCHNR